MKVNAQDFYKALKLIKPGMDKYLERYSLFRLSDVVLFGAGWISAVNEHFAVFRKFETGLKGLIHLPELQESLRKIGSERVEITQNGSSVEITNGSSKVTFKIVPWPEEKLERVKQAMLDINTTEWSQVPACFFEGLKLALVSAEESDRGKLRGIVACGDKIIATDNYRISVYTLSEELLKKEPLKLKKDQVEILLKTFGQSEKVLWGLPMRDSGWLYFRTHNLIFGIKLIDMEDYPLDNVLKAVKRFESGMGTKEYYLPVGLEQVLKKADVLAPVGKYEMNFSTEIFLKTEDSKLVIRATDSVGEFIDSIPWDQDPLPGEIGLSPVYLRDILKVTRKFRVAPEGVIFESPNFKYLMMAETITKEEVQ